MLAILQVSYIQRLPSYSPQSMMWVSYPYSTVRESKAIRCDPFAQDHKDF